MKRRNFIKLATSASAIGLFPFQITNALNIAKKYVSCEISNRKLVLIYLGGGNDGLNTIIPLNQYDLYSNLRPTIKIPDTGLNSYINLDLSLDESQQIGLHPSLTKFKDIYDAGNLRILQSVGLSLNIEGQDASGFYSVLSGLGGEPPVNIPNSHYGSELQYIIENDQISTLYSQAISNAFNSGSNSVSYEDTDLSNQLKTVARLISGGLQSKIYLVKLNGFDTHFGQVQSQNGIIGDHNDLLTELDQAVSKFIGTLLQDYLGADNYAIDSTFFNHSSNESICENKINELEMTEFSVAENCFSNTLTNQNLKKTLFKVLPNPFSKEIRIFSDDYTSDINLELFDLNSKLVLRKTAMINKVINLSNLINGIYILKIFFDGRSESHRLIKSDK